MRASPTAQIAAELEWKTPNKACGLPADGRQGHKSADDHGQDFPATAGTSSDLPSTRMSRRNLVPVPKPAAMKANGGLAAEVTFSLGELENQARSSPSHGREQAILCNRCIRCFCGKRRRQARSRQFKDSVPSVRTHTRCPWSHGPFDETDFELQRWLA